MKRRLLFIAYLLLSLSGNAQSANNWIRQMAQDGENLWLATNSGGLVKHNKQTGENTIYTTSNSGLCSDYLRSVTCHGGKVLVGSDNDGVSEFDGSTFKTYNEKNAPFKHSRLCFEEVIYDADGNMWLGGQKYIYKYDGTTWEDYTLPEAASSSWLEFSVLKFSTDSTLWFGTEGPNFDGSVGYITKDKEMKTIFQGTHDIYGMDIDKLGRVWYSCSSCGLYCYDGSNRRLFAKNESAYHGLCVDDDNNVWFGCDNLLYKYDGTAFTSYQVPTNGHVYDLLIDGNAIWVAVWTTGELFRFEDGQFESIDYTTKTEPETEENDDYLPFVEVGKSWVMARSTLGQDKIDKVSYWIHTEKVNHDGKGYYQMKVIQNNSTQFLPYLIREDNRKVYLYDTDRKNEFLMFDYSLKEGDTYETYSYSDNKMVTYKVLSVGDFTGGPTITRYEYDEKADSVIEHQRYLRKWTVCRADNGYNHKTWIEGVGSLEGPFGNLSDDCIISMRSYLAYVLYDGQHDDYLPFSFYDDLNEGLVWTRGCKLPTGKVTNRDDGIDRLTYELEGDRLHIYGDVFSNCGPNHYIYFFEEPTDEPFVHKLHYRKMEVEPIATCAFLRATDFYVSGFDQSLNYIVVDNQGVEHPVINKNQQPTYRQFVEDGKVWTYHYYNDFTGKEFYESLTVSGDTIINNKSYKKIVDVTTGRVDCAIREEGRKVYATYPHYSGEKLIYDFGLNVGDAFQLYDDNNGSDPNAWATVVSVDTIVVGSRSFRALDVRPNNMKDWPNWWVEGIGGMYHLTSNSPMPGNSYCFSSCKLGEDTLFTNHDFQTLGTIPSIETQMAYYYYKGDKVPLTLNENKVVVSIPKEYDGVCKRIRANLPVLNTITDQVFDSFIIPRSDFERLTSQDFWKEDAKSVVLTSSYYTEDKAEVFETPYLNVKLKKEEDASLLASYAERYRLKIDGNSSYMPLWYILHVTPESEKSPLKCANEIFESGEFASAVPDLSSDDDFEIGVAYRPFVEDGKVWKVGTIPTVSGNPVQVVDYYYFAGDTIVGGKTCKQMMCQKYVSPGFSDAAPSLTKVGAWYEEDKKVYFYDERKQSVMLKYDFTIWDNGSVQLIDDYPPFIIGPKQTGGLEGFKGVYRDVMISENIRSTTWLEGVGGLDGPTRNAYAEAVDRMPEFLMSCTVGDEVIYLNDKYEDGATPEGSRKQRIDFTHIIKTKPKAPKREKSDAGEQEAAHSLYGEYSELQLGINLNPLDDAYQVHITDESGKVVYEKNINAGNIVGLNIDISTYAEGRYTVTVENSHESFTGEFETQTVGIGDVLRLNKEVEITNTIYNLQGQRLSTLRKGLNIVDGQKFFVK